MDIVKMKERKRALGLTNAQLAQHSGVPVSTVNKILSGATKAPRQDTILALEACLTEDEDSKGCYTVKDYLAMPDDWRVELIDGVFYEIAAPHATHQLIAAQIFHQLMGYVMREKSSCKPLFAPVDVQLDKDDRTMVQPDLLILCKPENLIKNGRVFGAPDLVMEILSPATRRKDMILKLTKYSDAGVREYWMIDPEQQLVMVYDFENEKFPIIYTFRDQVPVRIWDSMFCVDFAEVMEYVGVREDL